MRRKDKEISDVEEIYKIIRKADFCYVAMSRHNRPYMVPMNFGFCEDCIYLHSASEGLKMDILKENPLVCIGIVTDAQLERSLNPCNNGMAYSSVLIFGRAEFPLEELEKKRALSCIVQHYSENTGENGMEISNQNLDKLTVLKVKIEKVTGKKSRR